MHFASSVGKCTDLNSYLVQAVLMFGGAAKLSN